jgi:nitroimidazol reductase NimA-like FMN-containing flavoprotein (pyridoxamine 5'-phosphate oxidase superfamily)
MFDNAAVLATAPTADDAPLFSVLGRKASEEILARNSVGRIAFALHDRVSIVPIHYVYDSGWIYGRTAAGGKLREILRNRRIAFEVDEHTELFEWRSVVVRGPLYLIEPDAVRSDRRIHTKAVSLIRHLVPSALTDSDPVPFRNQLFRIRVAEVSGRASGASGGKRIPPESEKPPTEIGDPHSDALLSQRVQGALATVFLSPGSQVHVDAFDGVIVLTGTAEDAAERSMVEAAVLGVPNVLVVVEELETRFPSHQQPTPAEIARDAVRQLCLPPRIVDRGIRVVVEHGWLRIEGVATSRKTRDDAVRRLRSIKGSRGVIDKMRVMGPAMAEAVSD